MTIQSLYVKPCLAPSDCDVVNPTETGHLNRKPASYLRRVDLEPPNSSENKLSRSQMRRRDDIVLAALKIFDRDGFEAAKMADIATEADVAKGTLYLYFDTKADLLEGAIISNILPALQKMGEAAQGNSGSARQRLTQQVEIAGRRMASPEMAMLLRHMISGRRQHQDVAKFYYDKVVQQGLEHIKATLEFGVETGEFRKSAKDIDPLVLVGAQVYTGVWNILFEDKQKLNIRKLTDDYLNTILNGLVASEIALEIEGT